MYNEFIQLFQMLNLTISDHTSKHIRQRILLINEPEPEEVIDTKH